LLPDPALAIITRKAGRHTRRACKRLRDVYPLDCGLRLDGVTSATHISSLLTLQPQRFHHISSLQLTASTGGTAFSADVLKAVARAFPQLGDLCFSSVGSICSNHLAHLEPLATCLRVLTLPPTVDSPSRAVSCLLQLSSLRALSLPGTFGDCAPEVARLSELQQLRHLEVRDSKLGVGGLASCKAQLGAARVLPAHPQRPDQPGHAPSSV
jgi:hypothetical protein